MRVFALLSGTRWRGRYRYRRSREERCGCLGLVVRAEEAPRLLSAVARVAFVRRFFPGSTASVCPVSMPWLTGLLSTILSTRWLYVVCQAS